MNDEPRFDAHIIDALGHYVYALKDPRDNKIFYVGVGQNNRVFDHFASARAARNNPIPDNSEKIERIIDIWRNEKKVDWLIIRRSLPNRDIALQVEASFIDFLNHMHGGELLNIQSGQFTNEHGLIIGQEIRAFAAPPVRPQNFHGRHIFIFHIKNVLKKLENENKYKVFPRPFDDLLREATKKSWRVSEDFRKATDAIAVGVVDGVSRCAFEIKSWHKEGVDRWAFEGDILLDPNCDLHAKSYVNIINRAQGYWQRGNYLIVKFNGRNEVFYLRGRREEGWIALDDLPVPT